MKQVRLLFTCILWSIFVLACSANYDTFGTSDYHKMNELQSTLEKIDMEIDELLNKWEKLNS